MKLFNTKSQISGIFKKPVLDFKDTAFRLRKHFCTEMHQWEGANDKFRQGSIQSQLQILGGWVLFVTLRKQLAENATKSYHVYKVMIEPHIYNKILGIRLAGYPANKNNRLILIKL